MAESHRKKIPEFERGRARGRKEGQLEGYEFLAVIMLMVMKDKFNMTGDFIRRFKKEVDGYTELVSKGYCSFDQMRNTLRKEYGITFHWRDDS